MKRNLLSILFAMIMIVGAQAQTYATNDDEVRVSGGPSIEDIIKEQQELTSSQSKEKHMEKVWSRKNYFNFNFNSAKLSPRNDYPTGIEGQYAPDFKSSWGIALTAGHNYNLLKKPVANIFQINIDYNPLELTVTHYGEVNDGYYNSSVKDETGHNCFPWNLSKYQFSYGMSVGPSITVAPFTHTDSEAAHFLKLNIYYHIGYQVSLLYMPNDKDKDLNQSWSTFNRESPAKLQFGHGLISAFGFNLSWKVIGIGYEYSYTPYTYMALNADTYGKTKYKFRSSANRVYLQLRF